MVNTPYPNFEWIKSKRIIQGGMGAGVSWWHLANLVSRLGGLGVVSGVALDRIMVQRLQNGDTNTLRALKKFPDQDIARDIIDKYFIEGGKRADEDYKRPQFPRLSQDNKSLEIANKDLEKLIAAANFVEVTLAKEGHDNPVGINYLYKIQWPLLPAIYGAMLAGVDVNLIGAGLPRPIPQIYDSLINGEVATMQIPVIGGRDYEMRFDPKTILKENPILTRPFFLGIVSNHLGVRGLPGVDGYDMEHHRAGGHNPPNRSGELNNRGEPDYGDKDEINWDIFNHTLDQNAKNRGGLRQPYWLAGGYADKLKLAIEQGAVGVQVGTPFAFCRDSAIEPNLKRKVLKEIVDGAEVFTSPVASPSGFPFKVVQSPGTISDPNVYNSRERVCNLGYLVELYENENGVRMRCPSERVENYMMKGGSLENTFGRTCLCNGLLSTIGLGFLGEMPLVTAGTDLSSVRAIARRYGLDYGAEEVIDYVLNPY